MSHNFQQNQQLITTLQRQQQDQLETAQAINTRRASHVHGTGRNRRESSIRRGSYMPATVDPNGDQLGVAAARRRSSLAVGMAGRNNRNNIRRASNMPHRRVSLANNGSAPAPSGAPLARQSSRRKAEQQRLAQEKQIQLQDLTHYLQPPTVQSGSEYEPSSPATPPSPAIRASERAMPSPSISRLREPPSPRLVEPVSPRLREALIAQHNNQHNSAINDTSGASGASHLRTFEGSPYQSVPARVRTLSGASDTSTHR